MKILVMADIHSNQYALEAVLEYAKKNDINNYIIAGDHISDCSGPNQVLDSIRTLNAWVIMGNREVSILDYYDKYGSSFNGYKQVASFAWTLQNLSKVNLNYLKSLNENLVLKTEIYGSIKVVHGSPYGINEHIFKSNTNRIEDVMNRLEEDVLICGHTHEQWCREINKKLIVNPGSVGVPFNSKRHTEFAVLEWHDKWQVKLVALPFDLVSMKKDFISSGYWDYCGIWPRLIIESINFGHSLYSDFAIKASKDDDCKEDYIQNEVWDKHVKEWIKNNE